METQVPVPAPAPASEKPKESLLDKAEKKLAEVVVDGLVNAIEGKK